MNHPIFGRVISKEPNSASLERKKKQLGKKKYQIKESQSKCAQNQHNFEIGQAKIQVSKIGGRSLGSVEISSNSDNNGSSDESSDIYDDQMYSVRPKDRFNEFINM